MVRPGMPKTTVCPAGGLLVSVDCAEDAFASAEPSVGAMLSVDAEPSVDAGAEEAPSPRPAVRSPTRRPSIRILNAGSRKGRLE
ncbi:hypothetical protein GCM10009690_18890 [Brevibacterium permense]|uniref:Uncharacterized protein n=1 Tax=Brevibacterium permense TaxID=234834 RepID=A0ABN2ADD9_9MICO